MHSLLLRILGFISLLTGLVRYIGVLNVTYRKAPKTKRPNEETEVASTESGAEPSPGLEHDVPDVGIASA